MKTAGIAVLGGLALLAASAQKSDKSADVPALSKQPSTNQTLDAQTLYDLLLSNPDLQKLLKGSQGLQGLQGIQGIPGVAGDQYRTFTHSLAKNSGAELGTTDGWVDAALGAVHEGLDSLDFVTIASKSCLNSNQFHVDNRRLYKITCMAKVTTGNYGFYLKRLDKAGVAINQNSQANIFPLNTINYSNTAWEPKTAYFGGIATNTQTAIGINTAKAQISLYLSAAATLSISHLCVDVVSLGEPVPYNLAYLPTGQMVVDPTTSEVGYYNGSAVVWFAL